MVESMKSKDASVNGSNAPAWVPGWAIGPFFLLLAAWFLWGPELDARPHAATPDFDRAELSTAPRRQILSDPPTVRIGNNDQTCMQCHKIFKTPTDKPRPLQQHKGLELDHGPNVKCSTCHHWDDRNKLSLQDGSPIDYAEVDKQCAQCHVKVHRDWTKGIHGRTNGFWDAQQGEQRKLVCTECHDPHTPQHPAMAPLAPLPGPNTLRARPHQENH